MAEHGDSPRVRIGLLDAVFLMTPPQSRAYCSLEEGFMIQSRPFYEQVQAHYDVSNALFATFLDPSMTYSCAYFRRADMTLEEAQQAKIDLSLGKCDLHPGMRLLDVGCGWGATAIRAARRYHANVVGLTLSCNQFTYAQQLVERDPRLHEHVEFRLQGWEEFDEPVDRIVSIGAFEHFRAQRHAAFFERCREILPAHGRMLLHCIVQHESSAFRRQGGRITRDDVAFARFIRTEIFPGGELCPPQRVIEHAQRAGFDVRGTQSLRLHYARTLDLWSEALKSARERAIRATSRETYDNYQRYLSGCAPYFRDGRLDVVQFTLARRQ